MADPTFPADSPVVPACTWCSAPLGADALTCPSCGANLTADGEPELPGVTAVDSQALARVKPAAPRNRLLSWISGDYPVEEAVADARAVAPPDPEVKVEIMRLELEATLAHLQAESDALLSEAVAEGRVVDIPAELRPLDAGDDDAETAGPPDIRPAKDAPPA